LSGAAQASGEVHGLRGYQQETSINKTNFFGLVWKNDKPLPNGELCMLIDFFVDNDII